MANAFSIVQSMGNYIEPISTNLVNTVLSSKQTQYNHNLAKVDEMLKQYTNLPLARQKDKEYLKTRLDNVLSTVNSVQKLDLSDNNLTRQIEQSIGTAIDDNVLQQVSNTQAISKFEQTVAEKREKHPELYDDRNYTIAKKRAGVNEYLAGTNNKGEEVNSLGRLQYDDYYDVDKNLTEPLEKWAKENGYTTQVHEDVTPSGLHIRQEERKILTPEQIEAFYKTKLQSDPKLMNQMQINSDYQYGGIDDNTFKNSYKSSILTTKDNAISEIARLEKEYKNQAPGTVDVKAFNSLRDRYKSDIEGYDKELKNVDTASFNRNETQMSLYSNSLLDGYKKTYSKDDVVSIDYKDTPLEEQKFALEVSKASKEASAKASGLTVDGQPVGTTYTPKGQLEQEEEKPDLYTVASKNFSRDYRTFGAYLAATDPVYAGGSEQTKKKIRDAYTTGVSSESITAQAYTKEGRNLAQAYIQSSQTYTKVSGEIYKTLDNKIINIYNGLKTSSSNLDLENFAENLPITAKYLTKKTDYNLIPEKDRALMKLEVSDNLKNTISSKESKIHLDTYNRTLQKKTGVKYVPQPGQKESVDSGVLTDFGWSMGAALDTFGDSIKAAASYPVSLFNEEAGQVMRDNAYKSAEQNAKQFTDAGARNRRRMMNIWANDEDLAGIGSDEIALGRGSSLNEEWKNTEDVIKGIVNSRLKDTASSPSRTLGISFNPNIKEEQPITSRLQSIALSNDVSPTKDTAYRVEMNPDGKTAKIIFDAQEYDEDEKGKQVKRVGENTEVTVDIKELPPALLKSVSLNKADYMYDYRNPAQFSNQLTYNVLPDQASKDKFLEDFVMNNSEDITQEEFYNLKTAKNSSVKTRQDYFDLIDQLKDYNNLTNEDVEYMKKNIVLPKYTISYDKTAGIGFTAKISNGIDSPEIIPMRGENYDPLKATKNGISYVNNIIINNLSKYAAKNARK